MAYRSHTGEAFASSITWTAAALPAGWQPGDVCLAFVASAGAADTIPTPPTGWTNLHGFITAPTGDTSGYCYYRVLQLGDTPPAFTWTNANIGNVMLVCYSGRDTTAPVEASAGLGTAGSTTTAATSSITTTSDLCDIVVFVSDDTSGANANYYTAYTGGLTERGEFQSATSAQQVSVIADGVRTPAGSGAITVTKNTGGTSEGSVTFIVALKPGAPGGAAFVPKVISYA